MFVFLKKIFISVRFQITMIVLMISAVTLFFYYPNTSFNFSDPKPTFTPVFPLESSDENINIIRTGIYIKNFPELSIVKNEFIADLFLWFEFDPHHVTMDLIEKFTFEKGEILEKSKFETKIVNGRLWVYYRIKLKFKSNLDYHLFPLEDHRIYMRLINPFMDPESMVLVSYNTDFIVKDKIFAGNWKFADKEVEFGYLNYELDTYEKKKATRTPIVIFSMDLEKKGIKKSLTILLPLFLAFILGLLSLILDINNVSGILSLSVGSSSSLIVDLFVIQAMTPDVRYFTVSDKLYTLLLLSSLMILMLNIYVARKVKTKRKPKILSSVRNFLFLFFIIFITFTTYAIIYRMF